MRLCRRLLGRLHSTLEVPAGSEFEFEPAERLRLMVPVTDLPYEVGALPLKVTELELLPGHYQGATRELPGAFRQY